VENENKNAPDLIHDLLKIPTVSFTIEDVEEFLGVSKLRARAVLVYALQEEKIRTVIDHNSDESRRLSLYDKASWHREWVTKKWCGG
jgi:response regulator of citrate/malate metabolism